MNFGRWGLKLQHAGYWSICLIITCTLPGEARSLLNHVVAAYSSPSLTIHDPGTMRQELRNITAVFWVWDQQPVRKPTYLQQTCISYPKKLHVRLLSCLNDSLMIQGCMCPLPFFTTSIGNASQKLPLVFSCQIQMWIKGENNQAL